MFTIIGGDGKEYGPVSADQIRAWIAAGRVNLETKGKSAGSEDWRPLGEFPEFVPAPVPPLVQPATPMVGLESASPAEIAAKLSDRAGKLDVFSCLDRSFSLWKAHLLPLAGATFLLLLVQTLVNIVPVVGGLAGLLLNGVFYGGLYYYYLGKMRGEPRTVGDIFAGFKRGCASLMAATVLSTLISALIASICFAPVFWSFFKSMGTGITPSIDSISLTPLTITGLILGFIVLFYLSVSWIFTFALIVDQGLGGWAAMEVSRRVITRQWFRVFFVGFLGGLVAMLGLIGLFIGIFFTLPIAFAAVMYAYEDLCNPARVA